VPWLLRRSYSSKYKSRLGYWPNIDNPKTLNEKIQWRKFYDHNFKFVNLIDKQKAKEYAKKICPNISLIPTQSIACRFENLDYHAPCIIKLTADSGGLWIIENSTPKETIEKIKDEVNLKIKKIYGLEKGEWGYSKIKNRVIAEELYENNLVDYSFYCMHSSIAFYVETKYLLDGKDKKKQEKKYYSYTGEPISDLIQVNSVENLKSTTQADETEIKAGLVFAEELSGSLNLDFVRIDFFFDTKERKWIFGEFTFYPGEGIIIYYPEKFDEIFGKAWMVDDKRIPIGW